MARSKRKLVTLLTDFGGRDAYVAAVKGVLLTGCPDARIVDLSHEIHPQDVLAASVVLAEAAPWFPPETLHVVVVDPGVGTPREILAVRMGGQRFLVPDNGVVTFATRKLPVEAVHCVRNRDFLPPREPSRTFHGRDIFAPVAAHVLDGVPIARLGPPAESYRVLDLPEFVERGGALIGEVLYVDRFGNLVSNIPAGEIRARQDDPDRVRVTCNGQAAGPLLGSYAFAEPGSPLALYNSMDLLEVAVNRGRAGDVFDAGVGSEVRVEFV